MSDQAQIEEATTDQAGPSPPGQTESAPTRPLRQRKKEYSVEEARAFWKAKKIAKKERSREIRCQVKSEQQLQWEQLSEEERAAMREKAVTVHEARRLKEEEHNAVCRQRLEERSTPLLVFDMSFSHVMNDTDCKSTASQLKFSYSILRRSGFLFKPYVTSFDAAHGVFASLATFEGFSKFPCTFDARHWSETFEDHISRGKLVYLTADTDTVLSSIEPDTAYVVGTFVDHNSKKGLTRDAALAHGARLARLPLAESIAVGNRCKVFTVNQVVEVLATFVQTNDWVKAFEVLPTRRCNTTPKDKRSRSATEDGSDAGGDGGW